MSLLKIEGDWTDADIAAFRVAWGWATGKYSVPITIVAAERSPQDVEKTFNDVLGDLAKDSLGKGAAEQLKDAAAGTVERQTRNGALGRAISRG